MTTLRNSQLGTIAVANNPNAVGLRSSQLGVVSVNNNPAAVGLRASQLLVIAVVSNGQTVQPIGPVTKLGCWTPCGTLAYNGQ